MMTTANATYSYRVAGLTFAVECAAEPMAAGLRPFAVATAEGDERLFTAVITPSGSVMAAEGTLAERYSSAMGDVSLYSHPSGGYGLVIDDGDGRLDALVSDDFTACRAAISAPASREPELLSSLLRILFSQAALARGVMLIHASAVIDPEGSAILFTGPSGRGKSTQARLWLENIGGTRLLNDDCPALRLDGGRLLACGTPWSGKTPCYVTDCVPVKALLALQRASAPRLIAAEPADGFALILPGCSAMRRRGRFFSRMCDILARACELAITATLECTPGADSAAACRDALASLTENS